jgi:hypothetical protein
MTEDEREPEKFDFPFEVRLQRTDQRVRETIDERNDVFDNRSLDR